jgi:CrcB protein
MSAPIADAADAGSGRHALTAVLLGGMTGTGVRLGVDAVLAAPWATLVVNLAGALLLGFLFERLREHRLGRSGAWSALGPGLCGALTTFSALPLEAVGLARDDGWAAAGLYLAATIVLGFALATAGRRLGRAAA